MKLTAAAVKGATPGTTLWDSEVPGLHLRVRATSAGYFLTYRTRGARKRNPKVGDARVMALTDARALARKWLLEVANGGDPSGDMQAERNAPTIADLVRLYLEDPHERALRSYAKKVQRLTDHVLPRLGSRKVESIEAADLDQLRRTIPGKIAFNRTIADLSAMFNRAIVWGTRPAGSNPVNGVRRNPEKKRRRYMKPDEALKIAALLDAAEADSPISVAFIRLLLLTGARPIEVVQARWEWLDGDVIRHPDAKTGARDIFLSPAARAIAESLPRTHATLTGMAAAPHKLWRRIRKEAGCEDLRIYDIRHSFASVALSLGMTLGQIGELLGHSQTQTTQRYAHLMDEHKHKAAAATAAAIAHYMEGRDETDHPAGALAVCGA